LSKLIEQQSFEPQTLMLSANIYTQNTEYLDTNLQLIKQFKRLKNALNYAQIFTQSEVSIPLIYQSGS
jgi:hypothetical protein